MLPIAFVLSMLLTIGWSEEPKTAPQKPELELVYVIYTKGGSEAMGGGVVITDPSSEEFHGVQCMVGRGVTGYIKGVKVRIPVDSVVMVMEFNNKKEWENSVREFSGLEQR